MRLRSSTHRSPFLRAALPTSTALAAVLASSTGCTRAVGVDLQVVEPCGQDNQALNGVSSFRMISRGADPEGVVAFTSSSPQSLAMGLGDKVVVSVEAYSDDITVGADPNVPGVLPKAVGRTPPLAVGASTTSVSGVVMVGKVDSFGAPRSVDGECTTMSSGRHGHTVTWVPKHNKVLIFGGASWTADGSEGFLKSAEVYDPATGTFAELPAPANARAYHTATALPDGRVLIAGGFSVLNGGTAPLGSAVLVDVNAPDPYVQVIRLRAPRAHHTATLLPDVGLIAIIGGCTGFSLADGCGPDSAAGGSTNIVPSIEVIEVDNITDESEAAAGQLTTPRAMHAAVGFPSNATGFIAVAGGLNDSGPLRGVEFIQIGGGSFVNAGAVPTALPEAVVRHQMVAVDSTRLAITGGQTAAPAGRLGATAAATAATVVCDTTDLQAACAAGPVLGAPRYGHAMARMQDGSLLVLGGVTTGASAEVLRGSRGAPPAWAPTGALAEDGRDRAAFTLLGGDTVADGFMNQIFYSGGFTADGAAKATSTNTDIYFGK
jgi:hypothetical protein